MSLNRGPLWRRISDYIESITGDIKLGDTAYIDDTNNRVGIGTVTPDKMLHLVGGKLLIGTDSSLHGSGANVQIGYDAVSEVSLLTASSSTRAGISLIRSRGTLASEAPVVVNDSLGFIGFKGSDGSGAQLAAIVEGFVDGTVSNGYVPSRLSFVTGSNGGDRAERLTVKHTGLIGVGTTTPDTKLQVVGNCKFGDDNTNYALFNTDGELTLIGTARVINHLRFGAGIFKPGTAAPTEGFTGLFPHLSYSHTVNQEAHFTELVPYRWDDSEDIEVCVDWCYTGTQDNGTVKWDLEYRSIENGETVDSTTVTVSETTAGTHTTGELIRTCFTSKILASNLSSHDLFGFKLIRDQANDTMGTGVEFLAVHFHYIKNKLGQPT